MNSEKEGYIETLIPARIEKSCFGCKHHNHHMISSGQRPLYANSCTHSEANGSFMGRDIGEGNGTPDWCPVGLRKDEIKEL